MDIEKCREICLRLNPAIQETFPFDDVSLVMKIADKMFALLPLDTPDIIALKCDPERAIELRERYHGINPAYHFNKKYWNQVSLHDDVPDSLITELIAHSFQLVAAKLTRKQREELAINVNRAI